MICRTQPLSPGTTPPAHILFAIVIILAFHGCSQKSEPPPVTDRHQVIDDLDHVISFQSPPGRIVSLAPNITETLFSLGAGEKIVGVTEHCNFPPEAQDLPSVGGLASPNLERIIDLSPDLVVMSTSGNIRADYEKLTSAGITVFVSNTNSLESVFNLITRLGILTDREDASDSVVAAITTIRDSIVSHTRNTQPRSVLLLVSFRPLIAASPETYLGKLITMCNGQNIVSGSTTAYPVLNREEVLRMNPAIILMTSELVSTRDEIIQEYPEWKSLTAIRSGKVYTLDADVISRPGPRVGNALRLISRYLGEPESDTGSPR